MNHKLLDSLKEMGLGIGIRPFCRDDGVDYFGSKEFVFMLQKNQEVHMWESMFLEFN